MRSPRVASSAGARSRASAPRRRAPARRRAPPCGARRRAARSRARAPRAQPLEHLRLGPGRALARAQHDAFPVHQLLGREALRVRGGLLATVLLGRALGLRARELDRVAEDAVVAHAQRAQPGALALARLERIEIGMPLIGRAAHRVDVGIDTVADVADVRLAARRRGRIVDERALERRPHLRERALLGLGEGLDVVHRQRRSERRAQRRELARAAAGQHQARQDPLEIAHAAQRLAQPRAAAVGLEPARHLVLARGDRGRVEQRLADALREQPAPHRRAGAVDHLEQRPAQRAVARVAHQLEVRARRGIEHHAVRRAIAPQHLDRRERSRLTLRGRDPERRGRAQRGLVRVARSPCGTRPTRRAHPRDRSRRRQHAQRQRARQVLVGAAHDQLARRGARELGIEHGALRRRGRRELAGRDVEVGEAEARAVAHERRQVVRAPASVSRDASATSPGEITSTISRRTSPLASLASSTCSPIATRCPASSRRRM